jgi:TPR repeat protein/transglutaminase-like putative cysteine protease
MEYNYRRLLYRASGLSFMLLPRLLTAAFLAASLPAVPALAAKAPPKAASSASFVRGAPLPKWIAPLAPVASTVRRDPIVVRLAETQAWTGVNPAVLVNRAIQVNDKARLGEIGQYGLTYYPAYQKLLLHRVAILRGDQVMERTATVNTRLLEREPSLESGFYVGATSVQLLLDDIRIGDTLLITYTTEGSNPVFGKVWADDFSWDHAAPIELRRLTVSSPLNQPLRWRELGDVKKLGLTPVIERTATIARTRFEGTAIEAVEFEPSTPTTFLPLTMIQTSDYASWKEVATWASGLFERKQDTAAVAALARQFAAGKTQEERASAALHWVQDEIRYFSVALGENSHRPQAPEVVLKRRYGDCKDKSNLLIALLGQLGIKAEPVLVSANAPTFPARVLPTPTWFDHVIVRVEADGKTFFIDPTREGEKGQLSRLPVALPGAAALVVAPSTDALLTLPEDSTALPMIERSEKFVVADLEGDALLDVKTTYRGASARSERMRFGAMSAAARHNELLGDFEKQFHGAKLVGDPVAEDGEDGATFAVAARLTLPKPVTVADGWHSLTHKIQIMDGSLGIPDKLARKTPFGFPVSQYRARYRLQIVWPRYIKLIQADNAKTVDNKFFTAHSEYSWRANETEKLVDYVIKRKQIDAAELVELEAASKLLLPFVESSLSFNERVKLKPDAGNFSVQDGQLMGSLSHGLVIGKEISDNPKVIASPEAAALLCEVALGIGYSAEIYPSAAPLARLLAGQVNAIKGLDGARENCRGRNAFNRADYGLAVSHWVKAGAPKDGDSVLPDLAWARLASGDSSGAAADATRFVNAALKEGTLTASDAAFTTLIFQRLGQPVLPGLQAFAAATADGPWPRPILGFLAGQLSQQQLLDAAARYGPDKQEMALNEAWFYIGERLRQAGKIAEARDAWRWYPANGIRGTREEVLGKQALYQIEFSDPDLVAGKALLSARSPDYKAAKALLLKAAGRGIGEAEGELGILAEYGRGGPVNLAEAHDWYSKAAAHGNLDGINDLAVMYDNGEGVPVDQAKAHALFLRAAAFGHYHASRNLGRRFLYGEGGGPRNGKEAMRHLSAAAKLGNANAQELLSEMYFSGDSTDKDLPLSLYWASRSAEQGNVEGMARVAFMYAYGHGVTQDQPKAIALWRKAAAGGSASAQTQLGDAYLRGRGVEKDLAQSLKFFNEGAAQGNLYAAERAGIAYLYGDGTAINGNKARAMFDMLVAKNVPAGNMFLGFMAEKGTQGPANLTQARRLITLCAEQGLARCQATLGLYMTKGTGGPVDLPGALGWYRKAADQDYTVAINNLADMYEKGTGVTQDLPQAVRLYRKAAAAGNEISLYSLGELNETGKGMLASPYLAYAFYQAAHNAGAQSLALPAMERVAKTLSAERLAQARAEGMAWKQGQPLPGDAKAQ